MQKKIFSICIYVISYSKYFQEYFVIIHFSLIITFIYYTFYFVFKLRIFFGAK